MLLAVFLTSAQAVAAVPAPDALNRIESIVLPEIDAGRLPGAVV